MIIGMVRYAIPNSFMNSNNSRSLVQLYEDPYFSDRFNIFRNITLPSFAQQTNQDFTLCVYHTNLIPDDKKALFDNLAKQYPFLRNVYTAGKMDIPAIARACGFKTAWQYRGLRQEEYAL